MRVATWFIIGLVLRIHSAALVEGAEAPPACAIRLADVTRQTGIDFIHTDGSSGQRYIVETVSAGLATFDYDNDGLIDILFLNGAPLRGATIEPPPTLRLYRNLGSWRFADVTRNAGLNVTCYALGVAVADYDQDGQPDIFVNNFGTNLLFRNQGDGIFTDVTAQAGVSGEPHVGAGTCFLDADNDGHLDLFVSHYVDFTYETHRVVHFNGRPAYVGPLDYPATLNRLYRNQGDGTFKDVSVQSGIAAHPGSGMGMICCDIDQDRDTDIFVGNDELGNFLFLNDGKGHFEESSLVRGLSLDFDGKAHGTMGTECGDYDNDGWLDFFVTSYQQESVILFRNLGKGIFEDVTRLTGAGAGTLPLVTWGCGLVDFDHDADLDLFIAAGHLQDNIEQFDTTTSYAQRNLLLMNTGNGRFVNVTDQAGGGLSVKLSSRGAAFDDLDNDGDIDVVILNSRREPTVLRNDSAGGQHWLEIQLRGTRSNRDAVGAQVRATAPGLQLIRELHSGRGYQSHYGARLHFGLGNQSQLDQIEVRWPEGASQVMTNIRAGQLLIIAEGNARATKVFP